VLYILPCSITKSRILLAGDSQPARDTYTGQAFRMLRRQLERRSLKWCILSAYYGFIWPDTRIENYNVKMTPITPSTVWENCFGEISNRQYARLITATHLTVLGSRLYADAAAALLQRPVAAPFAGLSIGRLLSAIQAGDWV
jgi:hypothetical protein